MVIVDETLLVRLPRGAEPGGRPPREIRCPRVGQRSVIEGSASDGSADGAVPAFVPAFTDAAGTLHSRYGADERARPWLGEVSDVKRDNLGTSHVGG